MKKEVSKIYLATLLLLYTGFLVAIDLIAAKPGEATRFFNQNSTWYEKIPSNASTMANSVEYVNALRNTGSLAISWHEWSVSVWKASPATPLKAVRVLGYKMSQIQQDTTTLYVPIPQGAKPAGYKGTPSCFSGDPKSCYRDGHMTVISADGKTAWDFVNLGKAPDDPRLLTNGSQRWDWATVKVQQWDLTSDGVNQPYDLNKQGGRVAPVPLLHGQITYDEIQRGYIDHALAFAYGGPVFNPGGAKAGSPGVYPCVGPNNGNGKNQWDPWLGFRFQLDPTLDINSLNLTPAGKVIAKALQEYGMIFVENGGPGSNALYAEDLSGKSQSWGSWGNLLGNIGVIPLNKFRVVKPIYPSAPPPGSSTPNPPVNLVISP